MRVASSDSFMEPSHQGPLELWHLVQQPPALHALGPHLGLGCDVPLRKQVLELTEAHGPVPVLGLGPVIPLLLVALLYAHPLNGLGLSGNNSPEKKGK